MSGKTRHTAARRSAELEAIDPLRARHLSIVERDLAEPEVATPGGARRVLLDEAESPLVWLARRKGRDGRALVSPTQLLAGERLRADFTRAQMMPRMSANWSGTVSDGSRGGAPQTFSDAVLGARQRLRNACNAVGPEFSGLLLDVCCFLKSLPDVESAKAWPARSGKVVLQLGLDRLARHYGLSEAARGRAQVPGAVWFAEHDEG